MKKLKRINIKNFQTHEDTTVNFSDGITVLVGKTDSGKTAIIRSIKLIAKNKPRGNGFISVFAPSDRKNKPTTQVTLTLADDTQIVRNKAENKNEYILRTENSEERYNNFGTNIPPEIEEAIGKMSVRIDKDTAIDINIAEQLSQPFLLLESPAIKTKLIDKLAHIDVLSKAIKTAKQQETNIKTQQKTLAADLKKSQEELEHFNTLEQEKRQLLYIKDLYQKVLQAQTLLEKYKALRNKYLDLTSSIQKGKNVVSELSAFIKLAETKKVNLRQKAQQISILSNLTQRLNACEIDISSLQKILAEKDNILYLSDKIQRLKQNQQRYIKLINLRDEYLKNSTSSKKENVVFQTCHKALCYENIISVLRQKLLKIQTLQELQEKIENVNSSISKAKIFIPQQKQKTQNAISDLESLYAKLKICPVCKRPFEIYHKH